jgi:hypothetical protein
MTISAADLLSHALTSICTSATHLHRLSHALTSIGCRTHSPPYAQVPMSARSLCALIGLLPNNEGHKDLAYRCTKTSDPYYAYNIRIYVVVSSITIVVGTLCNVRSCQHRLCM